jgi:hypothetical protein
MFPLKDNIPTRRFPYLTVAIIVANVLVFFLVEKAQLSFAGATVDQLRVIELGAIPFEIAHPDTQCGPLGEEIRCGVTDGVSPPQEAISLP